MNFRKLCRFALVFFLIIALQGDATAAKIHGTVYEWYTFKPLNNSVVEINSTPEQNFIATDSQYSFNLTPGTYTITANYLEGNRIVYTATEEVVITDEGEYVHDLLLFPPSNEELLNQDEFEAPVLDYEETKFFHIKYFLKKSLDKPADIHFPEENRQPYLLEPEKPVKDAIFSQEAKIDTAENVIKNLKTNSAQPNLESEEIPKTGGVLQQRNGSAEEAQDSFLNEEEPGKSSSRSSKHSKINLPDDLKELLELVYASGNRISQRELRKKSPYSESKVSLMLSDLEERGLIEKFKRGRGNIIRIPDVHISR